MDEKLAGGVFAFFNEIGIISQLSTSLLAKSLPGGVHPSHFSIINHLVRVGDGHSPQRIANAMQVTKNTMTHSLKVLEDRNFITVKPDPDDGRAKRVYITEEGRAFREKAIQRVVSEFGHILEEEHLELMSRLRPELEIMRRHLDENR